MQAMIFCAGLGTRFKPWTDQHPKALALVNGRSLLQRNVEYLQQYGIRDVVINVHHFPEQIREAVLDAGGWGSTIEISDESGQVLETGGGLLMARQLLDQTQDFLTINADILTDLDLASFLEHHRKSDSLVSLAVSERSSSRCFVFDQDMRLNGWRNLQTGEERMPVSGTSAAGLQNLAYSGIALFRPAFFDLVPQRGKFSLVDSFLSLAAAHRITGFLHSPERWVDVGRPASVPVAEQLFP